LISGLNLIVPGQPVLLTNVVSKTPKVRLNKAQGVASEASKPWVEDPERYGLKGRFNIQGVQ